MTLKEKLTAKKAKLENRSNEVMSRILTEENAETRAALGDTLKALKADIEEVEAMLGDIEEPVIEEEANRSFNVMSTMAQRKAEVKEDVYSSVEYRKAFQRYMATGDKEELRAVTKTTSTNVSTVIPEPLADKILEKMEQLGVVLNRVTKTSLPVGESYAVDGLKPTATWVGAASSNSGEGNGSTPQEKTLGAAIVFAHYKLRCEVRWSEEVATMTLPMFEALFVKQVAEAMVRAKEFAVVEGTGVGMPTGILSATPASTYEIVKGKTATFKDMCAIEGLIPAEYENTTAWCMTKKTFMEFIGMEDQNGQPIARVNYGIDGKPERTLLGREVVIYAPQANSKLKNLSTNSAVGDIVAFLFDFSDYILNENYNLGIQHAVDWDNEDHKTKAVLACDGKVLIADSLIAVKIKGTA